MEQIPDKSMESLGSENSMENALVEPPRPASSGASPESRHEMIPDSEFLQEAGMPLERARGWRGAWRIGLLVLLFVLMIAGVCALGLAFKERIATKLHLVRNETFARVCVLSEDGDRRLDLALKSLSEGGGLYALQTLENLSREFPQAVDLKYFTAMAALHTGDKTKAAALFNECEKNRTRLGDALSQKAVLLSAEYAGASASKRLEIDKKVRALLYRAVAEDRFSALARVQLASFLLSHGESEEARKMLEAARSRLTPVDGVTAVSVQLALLDAQNNPEAVSKPRPGDGPEILFAAAYVAFRSGDKQTGSELLNAASAMLPKQTFRYLLRDPALQKYLAPSGAVNPGSP